MHVWDDEKEQVTFDEAATMSHFKLQRPRWIIMKNSSIMKIFVRARKHKYNLFLKLRKSSRWSLFQDYDRKTAYGLTQGEKSAWKSAQVYPVFIALSHLKKYFWENCATFFCEREGHQIKPHRNAPGACQKCTITYYFRASYFHPY